MSLTLPYMDADLMVEEWTKFLPEVEKEWDFTQHTLITNFRRNLENNPDLQYQGSRVFTVDEQGKKVLGDHYEWTTYASSAQRVERFSTFLHHIGIQKGEKVAIWANNSPEWTQADLAIMMRGAVSVPLYSTMGPSNIRYVLRHSDASVIICSAEKLPNLLGWLHLFPQIRAVVCFEPFNLEEVVADSAHHYIATSHASDAAPSETGSLYSIGGVTAALGMQPSPSVASATSEPLEAAPEAAAPAVAPPLRPAVRFDPAIGAEGWMRIEESGPILLADWEALQAWSADIPYPGDATVVPEDVACLTYTSGTTGAPKGVCNSHRNFMASIWTMGRPLLNDPDPEVFPNGQHVIYSYLPCSHIFQHILEMICIRRHLKMGYCSGTTKNLLGDLAALHPSILPGVPRVWNKLYDSIMANVSKSGIVSRTLFHKALKSKIKNLEKGGSVAETGKSRWDFVFKKLRALLGAKDGMQIMQIWTGASFLSPDIAKFLRCGFSLQTLYNGFGSSESTAAGAISCRRNTRFDSLGHIMYPFEGRLVDFPELGYLTHPESGHPRGELQLKGPNVTTGYYKNPEANARAFTEDGFYRTGDIFEMLPDGSIQIVGRAGSVIKLSQGEFFNPVVAESAVQMSPMISAVYMHADKSKSYPVAVVIPDPIALRTRLAARGSAPAEGPDAALLDLPDARALVLEDMHALIRKQNLPGFCRPKAVRLRLDEWNEGNGLQTPTQKMVRPKLSKHYASLAAEMYAEVDSK
eukprot:gnl/Dysnectes_brevis/1805_a2068_1935.p1 GENE.gnl/Dysnectes_brevis/1805_a2068_1935~~gnl/Dysnectes_brevis/1805_a2068_1935.p1  ORF type:complete len:751 (-),score=212.41 gnl/Dysnectes_brevis/1805_a2068_1935:109-2361(-)